MYWNRFEMRDQIKEHITDVAFVQYCDWLLKMEKIKLPQGNPNFIATFHPRQMVQDLHIRLGQLQKAKKITTEDEYWKQFMDEVNSWKIFRNIYLLKSDFPEVIS